MPCGAVFLGLTAWSLAVFDGVDMTVAVIIKLLAVAVIIAIAAPPIPGSAFAVLPLLFSTCGIPLDVYPLAIILGTILGYLLPALNGFCLQLELLMAAHKLGKLDKNVLMSGLDDINQNVKKA